MFRKSLCLLNLHAFATELLHLEVGLSLLVLSLRVVGDDDDDDDVIP